MNEHRQREISLAKHAGNHFHVTTDGLFARIIKFSQKPNLGTCGSLRVQANASTLSQSSLFGGESKLTQISPQLVPYAAKNFEALFLRSDGCCRIFETVMQLLRCTEEDRARFSGIVANRDNIVEGLPAKFIDVF